MSDEKSVKDDAKLEKHRLHEEKKQRRAEAFANTQFGKFFNAFKSKSFSKLSNLARVIVFPIAILPVAGLFLGIGGGLAAAAHQNNWGSGVEDFFNILKKIGDIVFACLGILFATSIAFGYAKYSKGVAAVSAFIAYAVMTATMSALFLPAVNSAGDNILQFDPWKMAGSRGITSIGENKGMVKTVLGIAPTMDLSVLGGIVVGWLTALVHNRTYNIRVPRVLAFFGGEKFVPIACFLMGVAMGVVLFFIWPAFLLALYYLGAGLGSIMAGGSENITGTLGDNNGKAIIGIIPTFLFGMIERLLIPAGLHHVMYSPFWYTSAGGQWITPIVANASTQTDQIKEITGWTTTSGSYTIFFQQMNWMGQSFIVTDQTLNLLTDRSATIATWGDQLVADAANPGSYILSFNHFTMEVGTVFSSGRFAFMQYGYPAGAAAMIMLSKKENRKTSSGILISAAATSFLTGITEPILFSFLFVAPLLYVFDAIMAGISFALAYLLNVNVGQGFAAGFIDYTFFGLLPGYGSGVKTAGGASVFGMWAGRDGALWIPLYGLILMTPAYFFGFLGIIKWKNYMTPGRSDEDQTAIEAVQTSLAKGTKKQVDPGKGAVASGEKIDGYDKAYLETIIEGLGGNDNIKVLDNCATRLRVTVIDTNKVDNDKLKSTKAIAVINKGTGVQVIYGPSVNNIKLALEKIWKAPH